MRIKRIALNNCSQENCFPFTGDALLILLPTTNFPNFAKNQQETGTEFLYLFLWLSDKRN